MIVMKMALRGGPAVLVFVFSLTLLLHPRTGAGVIPCDDDCFRQVTHLRPYEANGELQVPRRLARENYKIFPMIGHPPYVQ